MIKKETRRWGFQNFGGQTYPLEDTELFNGEPYTIKRVTCFAGPHQGLTFVRNVASLKGILACITFYTDDWSTVEGTATIIGPGVAVTAFHVVSELLDEITTGKLQVMLFVPTASGGMFWRLERVYTVPGTDIAFLTITLATRMPKLRVLTQATLTSHVPEKGDLVTIVGYRAAPDLDVGADGVYFSSEPGFVKSFIRMFCSVGPVIDARQDDMTLCIDTKALGGMSGGAVFDKRGHYIGLLSTSIDHGATDGTSTIKLVWPMFAVKYIDALFDRGHETSLLDLPSVKIYERERFIVKFEKALGVNTISLPPKVRYAIEAFGKN